jgi:DNA-directed RNA polymerase subunit omega
MLGFNIDECLKIVKNKYNLILLARARASELLNGSQSFVEKNVNEKPFFTALKEISQKVFTYNDLDEKSKKLIKNEIFGIFVDQTKTSVDQFNDSSIFAKSFLKTEDSLKEKESEINDLSGNSSNNSVKGYFDDSNIKMIGSFENLDQENLSDFTDGLEIFENENFENNQGSEFNDSEKR